MRRELLLLHVAADAPLDRDIASAVAVVVSFVGYFYYLVAVRPLFFFFPSRPKGRQSLLAAAARCKLAFGLHLVAVAAVGDIVAAAPCCCHCCCFRRVLLLAALSTSTDERRGILIVILIAFLILFSYGLRFSGLLVLVGALRNHLNKSFTFHVCGRAIAL